MLKKLVVLGVALIMLLSLSGCNNTRDPGVFFNSIEEMEAALPSDFYFFEVACSEVIEFSGASDTTSVWRHKKGNFEYIGYSVAYIINFPAADNINLYFDIIVYSTKTLDESVKSIGYILAIENIDCFLIDNIGSWQLYFMLENIRYCFSAYASPAFAHEQVKEYFLTVCETAIINKYKVK